MTENSWTFDLMNISEVRRPERVLLLEPKEMDRGGRKPIARTTCEITFSSEENLLRCVRALKESDEVLQKRPDEMKLWEWNKTYREGMKSCSALRGTIRHSLKAERMPLKTVLISNGTESSELL